MRSKLQFAVAMLLAGLCLFSATPARMSADDLTADVAGLDESGFPTLTAVVNVLDAGARPIAGLTNDNFTVTVGGQPAAISSLQTAVDAQVGLAVVLAVDVSGSMSGEPLAQAKTAAKEFVVALSPQDSVAIVTFGDTVTLVQDFTADKAAATAAIDALQATGNTALYDAASKAMLKAAESPLPRKVVVLLSDGYDYGDKSAVSRDDSFAQVRFAAIPIYAVGLGTDIDREYLTQLSQATGARFLETPTAEGLSQLYAEIGNVLRSQYVIELTSPVSDRSQPLQLEVSVTVGAATATASRALSVVSAPVEPPVISVAGLSEGQELAEALTVEAKDAGGGDIVAVSFSVDGEGTTEDKEPPFQFYLDPVAFGVGSHTLRVEAVNAAGLTGDVEMTFVLPAPPAGGGGLPKTTILGVMALAALAVVAAYLFIRRWVIRVPREAVQIRLRPWSNAVSQGNSLNDWFGAPAVVLPSQVVREPRGKLVVLAGPSAGQAFDVGDKPISIGSAEWCTIVLPEADGEIAPEEARAWVHQSKRLVFHRLTRLSVIASEGSSGGWVVLQDGDEVTIGPCRLLFQLVAAPEESAEDEAVSRAIDDALRVFDGPKESEAVEDDAGPAQERAAG